MSTRPDAISDPALPAARRPDAIKAIPVRHPWRWVVAVVVLAAACDVSAVRWALLLICGSTVLTVEVLNSSIEALADYVQREYDEDIRAIKDLAAGAALVAATIAGVVGVIVFWPYVVD